MSVITSYRITGKDSGNNPINLRDQLVAMGVVKMTDSTHGALDLSKADPHEWAKEIKEIRERGVVNFGNPYDGLKSDGTVEDTALTDYLRRFRIVPPDPDGRKVYAYSVKYNVVCELSRDRDFRIESIQEKPLSAKETERLRKEAVDYIKSYKRTADGHYRRDYFPVEIEQISRPQVTFSEDGACMSYIRNYDSFDFTPFYYASRALNDIVFECVSYTEGALNSHGYMKNGEAASPSGRPCHNILSLSNKCICPVDNKTSKITFYMNESMDKTLLYINSNDIADSPRPGRSEVYLTNKKYVCYDVKRRSKEEVFSEDIVKCQEVATAAFKVQLRNKKHPYAGKDSLDEPELDER